MFNFTEIINITNITGLLKDEYIIKHYLSLNIIVIYLGVWYFLNKVNIYPTRGLLILYFIDLVFYNLKIKLINQCLYFLIYGLIFQHLYQKCGIKEGDYFKCECNKYFNTLNELKHHKIIYCPMKNNVNYKFTFQH